MKKGIINIIKSLIVIVLFFVIFIFLNRVFIKNERSIDNVTEFYDLPNDSLDVLVLGSSHAFNSVVPVILNDELNIDSYNLSTGYNYVDQSYFLLKETLKFHQPKIVILEMYSIRDSVTYYENHHIIDRACHRAFDGMKLSLNKVDAINSNILNKDARLPFLIPIVDYHAKWKNDNVDTLFREEINDNRFDGYYGYSYHALDPLKTDELFCYDVGYYSDVRTTPVTEAIAVSDDRMKYIEDITTLCNENDIKLIYYISPFIYQEEIDYPSVRKWVNSLETHITENDIDLIDFNEISVELELDDTKLTDPGHCTMEGANIVTHYLADYIEDKYSFLLEDCTFDTVDESSALYSDYLNLYSEFLDIKEQLLDDHKGTN